MRLKKLRDIRNEKIRRKRGLEEKSVTLGSETESSESSFSSSDIEFIDDEKLSEPVPHSDSVYSPSDSSSDDPPFRTNQHDCSPTPASDLEIIESASKPNFIDKFYIAKRSNTKTKTKNPKKSSDSNKKMVKFEKTEEESAVTRDQIKSLLPSMFCIFIKYIL